MSLFQESIFTCLNTCTAMGINGAFTSVHHCLEMTNNGFYSIRSLETLKKPCLEMTNSIPLDR